MLVTCKVAKYPPFPFSLSLFLKAYIEKILFVCFRLFVVFSYLHGTFIFVFLGGSLCVCVCENERKRGADKLFGGLCQGTEKANQLAY